MPTASRYRFFWPVSRAIKPTKHLPVPLLFAHAAATSEMDFASTFIDAASVEIDDFEPPPAHLKVFADLGDCAELPEQKTSKCLILSRIRQGTLSRSANSTVGIQPARKYDPSSRFTAAGSAGPSSVWKLPTMASRISALVTTPWNVPYSSWTNPICTGESRRIETTSRASRIPE